MDWSCWVDNQPTRLINTNLSSCAKETHRENPKKKKESVRKQRKECDCMGIQSCNLQTN